MRDIVKSGELGSVIGYKSTRVRWGNPHRDADCIWNFLPHDLSIVHEVLGYIPTPKSAVSEVLNGVAVSLQALMGDSPWASVEVSCNERTVRQEVRLICEKGVVLLSDPYADHLMIEHLNPADIEKPLIEKRTISTEFPLLLELRAFLDHLSGGPPPRASAANGAMIVEMIARLRTMAGLPN